MTNSANMLPKYEYFFPFSDSNIKVPDELSRVLSTLNFSVPSVWTLPFRSNQSFLTFYMEKLYVWESNELLHTFQIEGIVLKNRAVILSDNHLFILLNDDYLYHLPDVLDKNSKFSIIEKKGFHKVTFISSYIDSQHVLALTADNLLCFIDTQKNIKREIKITNQLSFFKCIPIINNEGFVGAYQNTLYFYDGNFNYLNKIVLSEYSELFDFIPTQDIQIFLIIGRSSTGKLLLEEIRLIKQGQNLNTAIIKSQTFSITQEYDSCISIEAPSNIYLTFREEDEGEDGDQSHGLYHEENQQMYFMVTKSGIFVIDGELRIIGKKTFHNYDVLISSRCQNIINFDNFFIHNSKSGIHQFSFPILMENCPLSDILFYYIYLFYKTKSFTASNESIVFPDLKKKLESQSCETVAKSEVELYSSRNITSLADILFFHGNLISLLKSSKTSRKFIPYLNSNRICYYMLDTFKETAKFVEHATFHNLPLLFDNLISILKVCQDQDRKIPYFKDLNKIILHSIIKAQSFWGTEEEENRSDYEYGNDNEEEDGEEIIEQHTAIDARSDDDDETFDDLETNEQQQAVDINDDECLTEFAGHDKLKNYIQDAISLYHPTITNAFILAECKLKLTKESIVDDIDYYIKNTPDKVERFALRLGCCDALYTILKSTADWESRAIKYAEYAKENNKRYLIRAIYNRFCAEEEQAIRRTLAILPGWESVEEHFSFRSGRFRKLWGNHQSNDAISKDALLLLCNRIKNNTAVQAAFQTLQIFADSTPSTFFEAFIQSEQYTITKKRNARFLFYVSLSYYAFLRMSELLTLKGSDIAYHEKVRMLEIRVLRSLSDGRPTTTYIYDNGKQYSPCALYRRLQSFDPNERIVRCTARQLKAWLGSIVNTLNLNQGSYSWRTFRLEGIHQATLAGISKEQIMKHCGRPVKSNLQFVQLTAKKAGSKITLRI